MKTPGSKQMKRIVSLAMAVLLGMLLAGCGGTSSTYKNDKTAAPVARQDNGESESMGADPNLKEVECDWHIRIDEQIPWKMGDSEFKVTFQFSAHKTGGTGPKGDWTGEAFIILDGDAQVVFQSSDVSGTIDAIGKDDSVAFVLDDCGVPVKVAPPQDFMPVAPLTAPDYYTAGQYLNFAAATDVDILFPGSVHYGETKSFTGKRYIHITVNGLVVTAQIEGIGSFTGTCEGIPSTPVTSEAAGTNEAAAHAAIPPETDQPDALSTGSPAADSYNAYVLAKSEIISRISGALSSNPGTELDSFALLGVTLVDMALLPACFLGLGQEAVSTGLAMMNVTGVQYTEAGSNYTVIYKGSDGENYEFHGSYDAAAEALVCDVLTEGNSLHAEHRKTPFGYVGQVYSIAGDGATFLIQIAIQGGDGVIGLSDSAGKPKGLTGGEPVDFPKACAQWYAVTGTTVTGITGDGQELILEYIP